VRGVLQSVSMEHENYVIRGGVEGRDRLRILSRVMQPTTLSLFDQIGIRPGMACLDMGCGGGDISFDLARMVGTTGRVVGIDIDETKIEIARSEAIEHKLFHVDFFAEDINKSDNKPEFDVTYARFLLTHLSNPNTAVQQMLMRLIPGGVAIIEDIDFNGHFCYPENSAFKLYVQLYSEVVYKKGGDSNIGPRLPGLLMDAGFENVRINVVQPAGMEGPVKLIAAITMENIAHAVFSAGLASRKEIEEIIQGLYELAEDKYTVCSLPRIVQTWGYKPK